ncbi:hypothetical protein IQ235_05695 [Oscillatoriales cyanobacterium LEGE 11467]|uniref:Signal transduction histidine kinase LytS n=1 Tax=Zarconia navalis LEGE 11467 TaxID=1828826 RepID=A0A928Z885_9CYAN|nr:hypothetical protein [Zarconia navalis]MBE9040284.1 hypothetical protein [Zarconia navalis LEGE 11467]
MATIQHKRAVGTFPTRIDTEAALQELKNSNFPMDRVSVIARESDGDTNLAGTEVEEIGNKADEGAATGAATGGAVGSITGLLVGLGTLAIPGIGPIMLAGATATTLATTLAGTAIGAATGGLLGGLVGLGIPEERAKVYSDRVSRGEYLVTVEGTEAEINQAAKILSHRGIQEWGVYESPATTTTTTETNRVVGVFSKRQNAEAALEALDRSGFPMAQATVLSREPVYADRNSALVARNRFEETDLGLPQDRWRVLNDRFNRGEYIVAIEGTPNQIQNAEVILNQQGIEEMGGYEPLSARSPV